jgi:SAM-dependent methyltransferase
LPTDTHREYNIRMNKNSWNDIFKEHGAFFSEPHEDVPGIVQLLKRKEAQRVLDLGSGSGRHVVYLARSGFSVYGLDGSPEGVEITRDWLKNEGLTANLQVQSMTDALPYEDNFFDAIISVQVIHHAVIADIRRIVSEMTRVLRSGGFIFVTVPAVINQDIIYQEIEPNTLIPQEGLEQGLPHHYFTPEELREVFRDFEITDIHVDSVAHYCVSASKR